MSNIDHKVWDILADTKKEFTCGTWMDICDAIKEHDKEIRADERIKVKQELHAKYRFCTIEELDALEKIGWNRAIDEFFELITKNTIICNDGVTEVIDVLDVIKCKEQLKEQSNVEKIRRI